MDTELLKTFLEVHRCRHFGKAAENLYLTQSAVSFRIRQLESQLGVSLFTRHRNNIQLTGAGERLLPHAEAMLLSWQRAKQDIALASHQSVQLAISASTNVWDPFLQRRLPLIYRSLGQIALRADTAPADVMVRSLLERRLDLALLFDPPKVEELQVREVGSLRLQLVSSKAGQDLHGALNGPYVKVDWGTQFSIQHGKLLKEQAPPILHTGIGRIALDFILDHGGSAYLPLGLTQDAVAEGQLFQVAGAPEIHRELYAAYLKDADRLGLVEHLCQLLLTPAESLQ
ncbi:HTH-type transcriptional regulator HdfR [Gallaecimonas pentaromativorans]|uniref:LysR family transcriptional regulator n=1 Tax=Gallaecimonas pentaromativorans TaxID=584787 RepID=A0A3N1NSK7_9GAMM|nr:HTH-type transcriptional regulator HdfR [Gallaecimonas pentaromativorans]MED5524943.1 HTH-type transcriptional regulator HdfR [Pseudomonadota bacterium]ROQ18879.1 LysR family transcriptional regulator [Gallaecimonas pentaromativorans]